MIAYVGKMCIAKLGISQRMESSFGMNTQVKGGLGEALAAEHLEKNGFKILERNWTFGRLEIDIIASKDDFLAFVEVKLRSSDHYGSPWQNVGPQKQRRLIRAAHYYIQKKNWGGDSRFDIVSIVGGENNHQIQHIEGAFYPV